MEKLIAFALAAGLSAAFWLTNQPGPVHHAPEPVTVPAAVAPRGACAHQGHVVRVTVDDGTDLTGTPNLYTVTCSTGYVVSMGGN